MPIIDRETINIPKKDLKLDAVCGSGKGGQKINMTRLQEKGLLLYFKGNVSDIMFL